MNPHDDKKNQVDMPNWDLEKDIVIAGYGCAGAVAAIEAHDAGADILILESDAKGGGNTLVSFGGFLCPTHVEKAVTYISRLFDFSLSDKDDALIRVFVEEAVHNIEWIEGLKKGVKVHSYGSPGFPMVDGSEAIKKYAIHGKNKGATAFAKNLFELLSYAVEEKRNIPVMTRTPAKRLVTNAEGAVIGIIAERDGQRLAVRAKRGVILTTGGYAADPQMLRNHVKGAPLYSLGHPGNKGDGVRMAQKAGAGLWHMNGASCAFGLKVPEFESAFGMFFSAPAHIFVDKNGKRFVNETQIEHHSALLAVDYYDANALEYPRIPFYAVFDESLRMSGRISKMVGFGASGTAYQWSKDNSAEIEKGWIVKAGTMEVLAEKIDIDPVHLSKTVALWNQFVEDGEDRLFGRTMKGDATTGAISTPPFYAVRIHPCLINTQGGPRRNANAQVLDAFGEPIPGLYSAGELGSFWGIIYQGAGNIAECMVFGRIAGKNAAALAPARGK